MHSTQNTQPHTQKLSSTTLQTGARYYN